MAFGISFVVRNWPFSSWLVHYLTLRQLVAVFEKHVKRDGIVFDIGCSAKPYKAVIQKYSSHYFGLEQAAPPHDDHQADMLGSAYRTGLKDSSIDTVIATAVIEHLEDPGQALEEMHRIVKPGGVVIISAPLFWHIHEAPRDFYRYTKYGLEYMLKTAGFEAVGVKPLSGFWVTFLVMFSYYIGRLHRGIMKVIPIIPLVAILLQIMAFLLNKIDYKGEIWTWAYLAVGRKK